MRTYYNTKVEDVLGDPRGWIVLNACKSGIDRIKEDVKTCSKVIVVTPDLGFIKEVVDLHSMRVLSLLYLLDGKDSIRIYKERKVVTISLDSLIDNYKIGKLDLVRLDMDGGEEEILANSEYTLSLLSPNVLVELGPNSSRKETLERIGINCPSALIINNG